MWIANLLIIIIIIHNYSNIVEGASSMPEQIDHWSTPPTGAQPSREDVPAPPYKPPKHAKIKNAIPWPTDPIKPSCECFDSQTEIFLSRNTRAFKQLDEDIKLLKKRIQEANSRIAITHDGVEQNRIYDIQLACGTGKHNQVKNLNKYDCKSQGSTAAGGSAAAPST